MLSCEEQARKYGLQYLWIDACCIDPSNGSDLAESINSMFRYYQNAAKCYVYLSDVSVKTQKASDQSSDFPWHIAFRASKWFTRGWTLQELLAPRSVEFFSHEWIHLGDKRNLERQLFEITGIPIEALRGSPLYQFSIEERLSWQQGRETTREEDVSYSLFGIFDVNLPIIYGEGAEKAFRRLLREIDTTRVSLTPSTGMKIYHSLSGSRFRLFILNPGIEGSEITGYIQEFDLLEPPEYNAISYVWGNERSIHRIDVNHRQIFIRPNLFQALLQMRDHIYPVFLWIDSLCINQLDKAERSAQVRRMADIFQNAKNVWVWLGEEDSTSKIAMDFIPQIIQHDFLWESTWWEQPNFVAFDYILERPWFRRRWIIQEVAFSANQVVFCGDSRVNMNTFSRAINLVRMKLEDALRSSQFSEKEMPHEGSLTGFRDSPATRLLDIIKDGFHRVHNIAAPTRLLSLETLVDLAMFCETNLPLQPGKSAIISVDYSRNLTDVFADFILHCCSRSGSLDIICRPWASIPPTHYSKGHVGRSTQIHKPSSPSWIASIDGLPFGNPSLGTIHLLNGKSLVGNSQNRIYNAHYGKEAQIRLGKKDTTNTYNGSLYAKGIVLGKITQRSTRMARAIITNDCLRILGMDSLSQQSDPINLPDGVWRTLCANRDDQGEPASSEFRSAMVEVLQRSYETPIADSYPNFVASVSSIDIEELLETEISKSVGNFLRTTRNVVWNRRTFQGKKNDDSGSILVGLIPQYTRPSDQLCVLYGCSVPVVLRKHSSVGGHYWQLIGEAYVDGFMDGLEISSMLPSMVESAEKEFEIR